MDQSDLRSFLRWLDSASDQELQHRLLALEAISSRLTESDVIREFIWIKRKVLEEIDARQQCEELTRKLLEENSKNLE